VVTYLTARDQDAGSFYFSEYLKIFVMLAVSMVLLRSVDDLYCLLIIAVLSMGYIAYEVNILYFTTRIIDIAKNGYGGLDNNGAGLMLAMGIPICILLWDSIHGRWRWFFLALVPVILNAVLMTYSRGAMLSLVVTSPLVAVRCKRRLQMTALAAFLLVVAVPMLAGQEIRARFLTLEKNEEDESANIRRQAWAAAWKMAEENPIFGVGIRNANLFSYEYGADRPGRTIHSQYLQIAADNGLVGLGLYLAMVVSVWADTRFCRFAVKGRDDLLSRRTYLVATAVETSLAVFWFGSAFLSLEIFELSYLLLLLGVQLAALTRGRLDAERAVSRAGSGFAWTGTGQTRILRAL
jgi:probable O-glycosylation ligase (exosortase A-associated)